MSKGFASSYRIVLLGAGLFLCFGSLGLRLVWLHVVNREEFLRSIRKARSQTVVENARRGDILDCNGAVLATSRPMWNLGVDPSVLRKDDEPKWPELATLLRLPENELRKTLLTKYRAPAPTTPAPAASAATANAGLAFHFELSASSAVATTPTTDGDDDDTELDATVDDRGRHLIRFAVLRKNITEDLYKQVEALGIKGVYGNRVYRRAYPNNQLAAHLIGYVASFDGELRGVTGIENYANFYLKGQNGWWIGERDGRNRTLAQFSTRDVPKADGYDVTLSIDSRVQDIAEQELALIAQKYQPLKATIIIGDPNTGFILAMANYPTFNLNEFNQLPKEEQAAMRNVAVADVYEPGSVFKIVAASAALEEGVANPESTFNIGQDHIEYHGDRREYWGHVLRLAKEDDMHDFPDPAHVPMRRVISFSSNRGAAQLGMLLGERRFYRYARAFGFGQKLGFPVGGEVSGLFAPPEKWVPMDFTRIPMGHAIAATALQMHQAMSAMANGGVLYRPQIIKSIRDANGTPVFEFKPAAITRVVSEETAKTMRAMLMEVASKQGTAPTAAIEGYNVAGKTGTTQKLIDGKYSEHHHVASFVGFFPANPPPGGRQVAISVIVDDADGHTPNGVAYGSKVAAPSFKHIGEQLIPILDIKAPAGQPARAPLFAVSEGGHR
jgi:cell division protein FtsI/penicillin-binding protein 2